MSMMPRAAPVIIAIASLSSFACSGGSEPLVDGGEAGSDSAAEAGTSGYSALDDVSKWSRFDTTPLFDAGGAQASFAGAAFDGRYVYFVGNSGNYDGYVVRYDTQGGGFTTNASWAPFDVTKVSANARGNYGAVFDGRFVYFVPVTGSLPVAVKYDTQADFATSSSWSSFDMTPLNGALATQSFAGATFDGRYVYFVPWQNGNIGGLVTRYDTQQSFTMMTSWTTFDPTTVNASAKSFQGAIFDGRYVFFIPDGNTGVQGLIVRYDTQTDFSTHSSWSTFDMTTVSATVGGFAGGAFDGRYVYFVPFMNSTLSGPGSIVGRYDTHADFATTSSWSTFDTTTVDPGAKGFATAAFDGRYVYLVPQGNILSRYDTQGAFATGSSWSTFDITTVSPKSRGFLGAAFDGQYVYFAPMSAISYGTLRFDAKTPPALPPGYAHGSFL